LDAAAKDNIQLMARLRASIISMRQLFCLFEAVFLSALLYMHSGS
jgi:hypothetical protein